MFLSFVLWSLSLIHGSSNLIPGFQGLVPRLNHLGPWFGPMVTRLILSSLGQVSVYLCWVPGPLSWIPESLSWVPGPLGLILGHLGLAPGHLGFGIRPHVWSLSLSVLGAICPKLDNKKVGQWPVATL